MSRLLVMAAALLLGAGFWLYFARGISLGSWRGTRIPRSAWPLGLELERAEPRPLLSDEAVELGERLFFDSAFSRDRSVSCASCHEPATAFASNERLSEGVARQRGTRNAPSIVNRLLGRSFFWDGRAADLESQSLGPLYSPQEMALDRDLLLERLTEGGYEAAFLQAFGSVPTEELFARALAAFERTLLSADSPFDRYEWLGEQQAIGADAQRGLALFRGRARCTLCHTGTNFSDELFHDAGIHDESDRGREAASGEERDRWRFKTPSLRNVALTAPYMHDGSLATLADVLEHYDRGGETPGSELVPLALEPQETQDIVAFLSTLTGPVRSVRIEALEAKFDEAR